MQWLEGLAGPQFAAAVLWTLLALVLLVIVLVIVRLIKSLTFGTFVAGGRNRKTRLAVMDAAAVDSHRRLVLVRRDDIEHLLLIGGPTDVVVEREIRLGQPRRPALTPEGGHQLPAAPPPQQPPLQQLPMEPPPRPRMQEPPPPPPMRPVRQAPPPARQPERQPQRRPPVQDIAEPVVRMAATRMPANPPARQQPQRQVAQQPARRDELDDALMRELEVSFDAPPLDAPLPPPREREAPPPPTPPPAPLTLDDEMTRLLGELSSQKR